METKYALGQYESPKQTPNIFDYINRILAGCSQLIIAAKYQLFKLHSGSGIVKIVIVGLVLVLILRGTGFWKSNSVEFGSGDENAFLGFSLAPADPKTLRDESIKKYVERYGKVAMEESHRFGIPASISMAQGIIESRCGESSLAEQNNNHFGIKCFSKNCPKGHCSNFTDDSHKDFFRKYASAWESWREHSKLLSQARYQPLKKFGTDYVRWAKGLTETGYATDEAYGKKLIEIIEKYHLDELDD